jgi:ABC-type branched-subunit amino acid transport system substrate-binding protein
VIGDHKVNFSAWEEDTARTANTLRDIIHDTQVVAVIGPVSDSAAAVALPLLNEAGLLEVGTDGNRLGDPLAVPSGKRTAFVFRGPAGGLAQLGKAADFEARFGRKPTHDAGLGYFAMQRILAAIKDAGAHANDRQAIIDAFRPVG